MILIIQFQPLLPPSPPGSIIRNSICPQQGHLNRKNHIEYIPSRAVPSTNTRFAIFSSLGFHLSNFDFDGTNDITNNYNLYINSSTPDDAFITLLPGSFVEVEYQEILSPRPILQMDGRVINAKCRLLIHKG